MSDSLAAARPWRWLAALAIVANIVLNAWSNLRPFGGQDMATLSAKYPTPITPAGYAFSIWGLIFLGLLIYAVWQLLPGQQSNPLPDAVAKPLTLANLATGLWVVLFSFELIIPSVAAMAVILMALMLVYGHARPLVLAKEAPFWVSMPFAVYLGWISVAAAINFTIGLQHMGWQASPELSVWLAYVLIGVVAVVALLITAGYQDWAFSLTVSWALVGIWGARLRDEPTLAWMTLAVAVAVALIGFVAARQGGKRQPWEVASLAAARENERILAEKGEFQKL